MSKKSNPKPAATKTEAVEGVIETKAEAAAEQAEGQEQAEAATEQAQENLADESAEQKPAAAEAEESEDEAAPTPPPAASTETAPAEEPEATAPAPLPATPAIATPTDLANRLTQTVKAIVVTGAPEAVHALHKLEMAVGDLKNALPAAIAAASDGQLKADLTSLLAIL
jgi:hypothetical protein